MSGTRTAVAHNDARRTVTHMRTSTPTPVSAHVATAVAVAVGVTAAASAATGTHPLPTPTLIVLAAIALGALAVVFTSTRPRTPARDTTLTTAVAVAAIVACVSVSTTFSEAAWLLASICAFAGALLPRAYYLPVAALAVVSAAALAATTPVSGVCLAAVTGCAAAGLALSSHTFTGAANDERDSQRDPLTGLYNRAGLDAHVAAMLTSAAGTGTTVCVAFLDVDGLKKVNDTHGHDAGDTLIESVADALRTVLRSNDIIARWGGDEFVVVSTGHGIHPGLLTQRLVNYLSTNPQLPHDWWTPSVTVGHASALTTDPQDFADLLTAADADMYRQRAQRRHHHQLAVDAAGLSDDIIPATCDTPASTSDTRGRHT